MSDGVIRVLVIEDDPEDFILTRELLADSDVQRFAVERAGGLEEGLRRLDEECPDIVLLDLSLPDSQGWATYLRTRAQVPHLPVILLTGLSDEALGMRAVQEGAQDYLIKGTADTGQLVRAIRYAIERKRSEEQMERYAAKLEAHNTQMRDDLRMAKEVQLALLPKAYPDLRAGGKQAALRFCHVYRPCDMLGGDFFNVFPVSPTQVGLFICDVMGHGMRSALVTTLVRGLAEKLSPVADTPGEFLSQLNRDLTDILRQIDELIFASAMYLVLDVADGVVDCANAGHPRPLRIQRRRGCVEALQLEDHANGPALGLGEHHPYASCRCDLAEGDLIVLFTDGLYEVANAEGEDYGIGRLRDSACRHMNLQPEQLLQSLLDEAEAFAGSRKQEDDICIVGVDVQHIGGPTSGHMDTPPQTGVS